MTNNIKAFLGHRAKTMAQETENFNAKQTRRVKILCQVYGTTLVSLFFGPEIKPPKTKKVPCCFCGKKVRENSMVICDDCHDGISSEVANSVPSIEDIEGIPAAAAAAWHGLTGE